MNIPLRRRKRGSRVAAGMPSANLSILLRRAAGIFAIGISALSVSSCAQFINIEHVGMVGASHDGRGNISFHLLACRGEAVYRLDIGRSGNQVAPFKVYTADQPYEGYVRIEEESPGSWSASRQVNIDLKPNEVFIIHGFTEDPGGPEPFFASKLMASAYLSYDQIVSHPPEMVQVSFLSVESDDGLMTVDAFKGSCGVFEE